MCDPYLYEDAKALKNLANIKDTELLRRAEADITNLTMAAIYNQTYSDFHADTLREIHYAIFGQIYDWAGEFRTIQMIKAEEVLGGDTVRYAYPKEIKKQLQSAMAELRKLKRTGNNDEDIVFRLVRIVAQIWQIHPFREGNTRSAMVFAVLFARSLGFEVRHDLFKNHAAYVRNALVWASQGMYSKYAYLERIFFDVVLHYRPADISQGDTLLSPYEKIEGYSVKNDREKPHQYVEEI